MISFENVLTDYRNCGVSDMDANADVIFDSVWKKLYSRCTCYMNTSPEIRINGVVFYRPLRVENKNTIFIRVDYILKDKSWFFSLNHKDTLCSWVLDFIHLYFSLTAISTPKSNICF